LAVTKSNNSILSDHEYRHRIMYGLIVVMSTMILLIKFWPVEEKSIERIDEIVYHDEVLIDEMEITRQQSAPPPPPRPQVPQPVPDDEIIEDDLELEVELNLVDFPDLPEDFGTGLDGDEQVIVSNPQLPPSVVRIVEPSVPDLPNELRGRIEMVVNFLVNKDGTVEEASIVEIRKYNENRDDYEVLPFIQYGLMDATLKAALNWRFRAARHDGIGVSTFTTATFNY
jgi:hypothetical protein